MNRPDGSAELTRPDLEGTSALSRQETLTARAREFARKARAEATWRAYDAKWRRFRDWCAEVGEPSLPAASLTVARFLTNLAPQWRPATPADPPASVVEGQVLVRDGMRPSTLDVYRTAISVAHQAAGVDNPCASEPVRRVLAGIGRHRGFVPARRRTALRPADIAAVLAVMGPDQSLADARDTALFLIGWKAALRAEDLHRLDIADLRLEDAAGAGAVGEGPGLAVRLRRSKTDQTGQTATVGITAARLRPDGRADPLDAVTAWTRWHNLLRAHGITCGPVWRGVDRYGRRPRAGRMTHNAISALITRRAGAAGLDGDYGGHSLRRGFATSALAGGPTERAVQNHGRWKSPLSMASYVDEAQRYADTNPTRMLGL